MNTNSKSKKSNNIIDYIFLTSCFNRPNKTVRAVSDIDCQIRKISQNYLIVLVDCSTNSITRDKINLLQPNCNIITGSSQWYWAAAMIKGYEYIQEKGLNYKYLIPFNDDISLFDNSISRCIAEVKSIRIDNLVYSACFEDGFGNSTYGGRRRKKYYNLKFYNLPPANRIQKVDVVNMNLTFITKKTVDKIGFFDPTFQHSLADFDYSLMNLKSNGTNYISSFYAGICQNNEIQNTSKDRDLPLLHRFRKFNSIKEQPFRIRLHYFRKNSNIMQLILFFPLSYLSLIFSSFQRKSQ